MYFSFRVDQVAKLGDAASLLAFKNTAWRGIFWVSLPPGILFVIGSFMVAESPRWLLRRGKRDAAYAALLRSRTTAQADLELKEMEEVLGRRKEKSRRSQDPTIRFSAANTSSLSSSPASFSPAIRPRASTPSSPTTPTFSCRAGFPTLPRTGATSCSLS